MKYLAGAYANGNAQITKTCCSQKHERTGELMQVQICHETAKSVLKNISSDGKLETHLIEFIAHECFHYRQVKCLKELTLYTEGSLHNLYT